MTVRVSKPKFNLREKITELDKPIGLKGSELMRSNTVQDARNLIGSGRKNLIINGSCMIDQRNGGSSVTSDYAVDRTHIEGFNGAGTGTGQQVTDSPEGLYKSLKITVTGTDTSLAASDFYTLRHIIEGQNVAHLGFGSADAKTVTLSFWVKSSMTGIFCCSIGNGTNNNTMPKEYNINFANNWEYKTLTFPGATSGTWGTDNGRGFSVRWCMGVGSSRTGTVDTYNGNESHGTSNQTNLFATNGATFQITGMQLEVGKNATEFEHRSFAEELALCQRYYERHNWTASQYVAASIQHSPTSATSSRFVFPFLTRKRTTDPSFTASGNYKGFPPSEAVTLTGAEDNDTSTRVNVARTTSYASGTGILILSDGAGNYFEIDAEL